MNTSINRMIENAYPESAKAKKVYSIEDTKAVINCFLTTFERERGETHPYINPERIKNYIADMPYFDGVEKPRFDIQPEEYEKIIKSYFSTVFHGGCNYHIFHFFKGDIRKNRVKEIRNASPKKPMPESTKKALADLKKLAEDIENGKQPL